LWLQPLQPIVNSEELILAQRDFDEKDSRHSQTQQLDSYGSEGSEGSFSTVEQL
jgi:hypothetical protein